MCETQLGRPAALPSLSQLEYYLAKHKMPNLLDELVFNYNALGKNVFSAKFQVLYVLCLPQFLKFVRGNL